MAISFNNSANPTAVTFNGNTVNEVIFNGVSVWTAGLIPSIYQQLEYIESSGTQWIDTGVNGGTTPEFEIKFNNLGKQPQNYYMYFGGTGTYQDTQTPKIYMYAWSSDTRGRYGYIIEDTQTKLFYTVFDNNTVKLKNGNFYVNGLLAGSYNFNQGWSYPGYDVWIFNNSRESNPATMRLFYCKMWTDGVLVRDYIPVKIKATGEAGLYDLVTRQFYSNAGTGSFIAGPEMLPDTYTLLEYIEATGTQYIDTGVSGGSSCKYMISGMIKNTGVVNTYQHLFAGSDISVFPKIFQNNGSTSTPTNNIIAQSKASGSDVSIPFSNLYNVKFNIDYAVTQANRVTLNSTVKSTTITDKGWGTNTVYVFGRHETASKLLCVGRVYHLEMYTGNSLVRYYVPVKRNSDNELGLFDLVTQTFYTNQGTGAFLYNSWLDSYQPVEYIQSNGDQYIDTRIGRTSADNTRAPLTNNINVDLCFTQAITATSWNAIFGARYIGSRKIYGFYTNNGQVAINYNTADTAAISGVSISTSDKVYISNNLKSWFKESSSLWTGSTNMNQGDTYLSKTPIILFATSTGTSDSNAGSQISNKSSGTRIYYAKFYDGRTLIRYFIPCKNKSTSEVGMYDLVENRFYSNSGSGSFIAGPEKYNDDYWLLDYIESTGVSDNNSGPHIVLDVYGDEVSKFDIKARWYTIPTDRGAGAMLYEELNTSPWNGLGVRVKRTNGDLTLNYGTSEIAPITGTGSTINTDLEIKGFGNASTYTVNGTTYTHTPASSPAHYIITLFCENYSGDYIYHTNGRLYYAKLYDANGSVIRDLVPVKRISDGAIGMYDTVSQQFYTNSGSGTFSYGTN